MPESEPARGSLGPGTEAAPKQLSPTTAQLRETRGKESRFVGHFPVFLFCPKKNTKNFHLVAPALRYVFISVICSGAAWIPRQGTRWTAGKEEEEGEEEEKAWSRGGVSRTGRVWRNTLSQG